MTRPMTLLIVCTTCLAAGLATYRAIAWTNFVLDAVSPLIKISIGVGGVAIWTLILEHRHDIKRDRKLETVRHAAARPASLRVISDREHARTSGGAER